MYKQSWYPNTQIAFKGKVYIYAHSFGDAVKITKKYLTSWLQNGGDEFFWRVKGKFLTQINNVKLVFWHNIFYAFMCIILSLRTLILNFILILHKNERKNKQGHFLGVCTRGHFLCNTLLPSRQEGKERKRELQVIWSRLSIKGTCSSSDTTIYHHHRTRGEKGFYKQLNELNSEIWQSLAPGSWALNGLKFNCFTKFYLFVKCVWELGKGIARASVLFL